MVFAPEAWIAFATMIHTYTLSEHESKTLLSGHGIPVAPERFVSDPDGAAVAAAELGFPVAVKLCGRAIAHKTERGLVRLGLSDASTVRTAAAELLAAATPQDGDVALLVCSMVRGNRELIAGCIDDAVFGRCVMVGIGGILAEAVEDVVLRLAPIAIVDAEEMIEDLGSQKLLQAFRGEPPVDTEVLARLLVGLSDVFCAGDDIVSIDLNPLIVADGVPVAVDALVEKAAR